MNDPNEQSTKRFLKNLAMIIGVGIVFISIIYFGKKYKDSQKIAETTEFFNQFSDETYVEFAQKLEQSIHDNNPELFDNTVDVASLFGFSNRELVESFKKRQVVDFLKPQLKIGTSIHNQLINPNYFKYTKFYKKEGVPHIVFRLYSLDFINFMDFTLGIKKDNIVVTDIYSFYTGNLFSEMASEVYYKTVKRNSLSHYEMQAYQKAKNYLQLGNYEEAYNLLVSIPVNKRNPRHYEFLLLAVSNYSEDKLQEVITEMKTLKPDDARMHAYLNFQESFMQATPNLDKLNTAIDNLVDYVGEDPIFDFYRGLIYDLETDFEKAVPFFDRLITEIPDFFEGYYYKLYGLLLQNEIDEALSLTTKMTESFTVNEEDLSFDLQEFPAFINSEAYKNIFKNAE
ncbi:MAG: tetratricopeptide repeat protein [Kordia sp.]|uniref:tetratricopeptide repeat protein n=1 Tax=Kordia sp. TaxID=1965332 RepID=UPI00385D63F6